MSIVIASVKPTGLRRVVSAEDPIHKVSWELLFCCSINYQSTVVREKVFSKTTQHFALDEVLRKQKQNKTQTKTWQYIIGVRL